MFNNKEEVLFYYTAGEKELKELQNVYYFRNSGVIKSATHFPITPLSGSPETSGIVAVFNSIGSPAETSSFYAEYFLPNVADYKILSAFNDTAPFDAKTETRQAYYSMYIHRLDEPVAPDTITQAELASADQTPLSPAYVFKEKGSFIEFSADAAASGSYDIDFRSEEDKVSLPFVKFFPVESVCYGFLLYITLDSFSRSDASDPMTSDSSFSANNVFTKAEYF